MIYTKSRGHKAHEVDFYTGKDVIDKEEEEYLENQAARAANAKGWDKFYNRYISWLF
jgi:amino acid transporter